jgi:hypothetical protein
MMFLVNVYNMRDSLDPVLKTSLLAHAYSWNSAFTVMYPIEFMCLSAAKLMVLDRMSFAAQQGTRLQKQWSAAGRVVMAVVVLGNAVGLGASVAAALHHQKAAEAMSTASAYYAVNNSKDGDYFRFELSRQEWQLGGYISSVQSFCEVAVLLLIVVAFAVVGVACALRVSAGLQALNDASATAAAGRTLRVQIVGTTAFVFVAFLIRSVFSTIYAVSNHLRDYGNPNCPGANLCHSSCYNDFTHISQWMFYTPEFQLTIILISSPLALLVALWGMTSKLTLQLMKPTELLVRLIK